MIILCSSVTFAIGILQTWRQRYARETLSLYWPGNWL